MLKISHRDGSSSRSISKPSRNASPASRQLTENGLRSVPSARVFVFTETEKQVAEEIDIVMFGEDFADLLSESLGYWIESSACMGRDIGVNLVVVGGIVITLDGKMRSSC